MLVKLFDISILKTIYIVLITILIVNLSACSGCLSPPSEEQEQVWKEEREKKQAEFDKIFSPIEFTGVIKKVYKIPCCGPKCFCFEINFDLINFSSDSTNLSHEFCNIEGPSNNKIWIRYLSGFKTTYYQNQLVHPWDTIIKKSGESFFWVKYRERENWFKAGVSVEYYEDKLPEGGRYKEGK